MTVVLALLAILGMGAGIALMFRPGKNGRWFGIPVATRANYGPTKWVKCKPCKGAGDIELTTGRPLGRYEVHGNAVECQFCQGRGVRSVIDHEKQQKEWRGE